MSSRWIAVMLLAGLGAAGLAGCSQQRVETVRYVEPAEEQAFVEPYPDARETVPPTDGGNGGFRYDVGPGPNGTPGGPNGGATGQVHGR